MSHFLVHNVCAVLYNDFQTQHCQYFYKKHFLKIINSVPFAASLVLWFAASQVNAVGIFKETKLRSCTIQL